jgi:putative addiction module component (TIGR02574 family)
MSFNEVLDELPALSVAERQMLVQRALELDEAGLSEAEAALVEQRLAEHQKDPDSAVPLEEMKTRLRDRFSK